jgi:hypothetical protein
VNSQQFLQVFTHSLDTKDENAGAQRRLLHRCVMQPLYELFIAHL